MAARLEDLVNVLHKGRWVLAERSASQRQATRTVIQLRVDAQGPIYAAKYTPEGEGGQRNAPKSYSRDPQTSAAALAYFLAGYLGPLPMKKQYKKRSSSEVSRTALPPCVLSLTCSCPVAAGGGQGKRGEGAGPQGAQGGQARAAGAEGAGAEGEQHRE